MAAENGMQYFETSARGEINVQEAFSAIIDQVYQNKFAAGAEPAPARETIKIGRKSEATANASTSQQEKKKGCCK